MDTALLIQKFNAKEKDKNQSFLDLLLLFERDIRTAIGRTSDARLPQPVEVDYDELKGILHDCYQFTLRYRQIYHISGCSEKVNITFENLYIFLSNVFIWSLL